MRLAENLGIYREINLPRKLRLTLLPTGGLGTESTESTESTLNVSVVSAVSVGRWGISE